MAVGDSIAGLQRELRRSQRELERLNREMQRTQEGLQKRQQQELGRLRLEMEKAMEKRDHEAEKRYQRLLDEYNRKLQGELDREMQKMQADYEELKTEADMVRRKWEEQSRQLQEEVRDLKSHISSRTRNTRKEAEGQLNELSGNIRELRNRPCEFFCKGRFGIVEDMASQAEGVFAQEYYEAAMGLAMAAGSDARRLELEVEEGIREWENAFQEWKLAVQNLTELLEQEKLHAAGILESPVEMTKAQKKKHDMLADMDFWSCGEIGRVVRLAEEEMKKIRALEQTGIQEVLRTGSAMTAGQIEERIQEVRKLSKDLEAGIEYYQSVFYAYEDRYCILGDELRMLLEAQELQYISDAFASSDVRYLGREWKGYMEAYGLACGEEEEDYRNLYCMKFQTTQEDQLNISIIPVRKGNQVENQICYCPELKGAVTGEKYLDDLVMLLRQAADQARKNTENALHCTCVEREKSVICLNESMRTDGKPARTDKRITETIQKISRRKTEAVK